MPNSWNSPLLIPEPEPPPLYKTVTVDQVPLEASIKDGLAEQRQRHLAILQRYRDEVLANLEMRRKWVVQAEAQLEAVEEVIARLAKVATGGGDSSA